MAPPKNLVTAVCVILAAPVSYAVYQSVSVVAAAAALVGVGVVLPQLYAKIAVPNASREP